MILENFDFSILNTPGFLEDSVREEIITPILHSLGYSATGENTIVRSKALTHPYVYIGTTPRKISIIPDYVLYVNGEPAIVLDAKAPNEDIRSGKNVEQTFSYAIHKEIRTFLYALCNGKILTIFSVSEYSPLAEVDLTNLKKNWKELEHYLKPEYVDRPYLVDFHSDLGLTLLKLNTSTNIDLIFTNIWISGIAKMSEGAYTINSGLKYGDDDYMASFDFNQEQYEILLSIIPEDHKKAIELCLSRQPFQAQFKPEHQIEVAVVANLTDEAIKSDLTKETFVPFIVREFSAA
jgi:hypothetical protein